MDPLTFVSLLGSVASIVGLLQQNRERITPRRVLQVFLDRTKNEQSAEFGLAKEVSREAVLQAVEDYIEIEHTNDLYLKRISDKCIQPYHEAIETADDTELYQARMKAKICACANLEFVLNDNNGSFPSDIFKRWFEQFQCARP